MRSQASETQEILDPSFISQLPANTQAYFATYGTGAYPASGAVTTAGQLAANGLTVNPINGVTPVPRRSRSSIPSTSKPLDAGGNVPQNTYSLVYRVDFNMNEKTQMFFRGGREHLDQFSGSAFYSAYPQYDAGSQHKPELPLFDHPHLQQYPAGQFEGQLHPLQYHNLLRHLAGQYPQPDVCSAHRPGDQRAIQLPGPENLPGNPARAVCLSADRRTRFK